MTRPRASTLLLLVCLSARPGLAAPEAWKNYAGQPGESGWRCHVIQADPQDHGPDGINRHDWDGDGDVDVLVNFEEGGYSRLYFNPGPDRVRAPWPERIQFERHGPCEDSGIGDLDDDGDVDYIANGGHIYFNPGAKDLRDPSKWTRMTLFKHERRVPVVTDVDGDGLNDLIVGAQEWFKQPRDGKHRAENWVKYTLGRNRWPMNCLLNDIDGDGDADLVVPDRGVEICWYEHPGPDKATGPWTRHTLHPHHEPMFMAVDDMNGDGLDDFIITGGSQGALARKLILLLRLSGPGAPAFREILVDQPSGSFPKGVAVLPRRGDAGRKVILVVPKQGSLWTVTCDGDPMQADRWKTALLRMPGAETRKKMDNAYPCDLDADGDLDILTTEENGGWGVIWFENPEKDATRDR